MPPGVPLLIRSWICAWVMGRRVMLFISDGARSPPAAAFAMAAGAGCVELLLGRGEIRRRLRQAWRSGQSRDDQCAGNVLHHGVGTFVLLCAVRCRCSGQAGLVLAPASSSDRPPANSSRRPSPSPRGPWARNIHGPAPPARRRCSSARCWSSRWRTSAGRDRRSHRFRPGAACRRRGPWECARPSRTRRPRSSTRWKISENFT